MKHCFVFFVVIFALVGCGGGSTSSGGSGPEPLVAENGLYSGTRKFELSTDGADPSTGETPITFVVTGTAQNQQVAMAYREFSGTSALDPTLRFSIPTGTLRIPIGNGLECVGEVLFEGQFVGNRVTGTETGSLSCPGNVTININGTFEATFGASGKFSNEDISLIPDYLM